MPIDPSGHENQIKKCGRGNNPQHSQGDSPKPLSQPTLHHPQREFWLELGSHSAHLLSISLVAFSQFHIRKKKNPPEKHKQQRGGGGEVKSSCIRGSVGAGAWAEEVLEGLQAPSAPAVPS